MFIKKSDKSFILLILSVSLGLCLEPIGEISEQTDRLWGEMYPDKKLMARGKVELRKFSTKEAWKLRSNQLCLELTQ